MDGSVGEALVRATLEEAFPGRAFVKTRREPWLRGLELDCYNAGLRLGAEYQGGQHYNYVPHFHRNGPEDFEDQLRRDALKRERSHEAWVTVLEVPHTVSHRVIREHVRRELADLGYAIAPAAVPLAEFIAAALANGRLAETMLAKARSIAESHGGLCQSKDYVDCHDPLKFTCARGHDFEAALASVNAADHPRPRFCPECGGTRRRTFDENAVLVAPSGYTLLGVDAVDVGQEYTRSTTRLHLQCPAGHEFRALRSNFLPVVEGVPRRGCIRCARAHSNQSRARAERSARAALFGLEATDPDAPFAKRAEPTRWRCLAAGHEFEASWNTLLLRKAGRCFECRS